MAQQIIPGPTRRPQGGGTQRQDEEAVFAAVVYILVSGSPWRALPSSFGVSWQNAHRRLVQWTDSGVWEELVDRTRDPRKPPFLRWWAITLTNAANARASAPPKPATVEPQPERADCAESAAQRTAIRFHPQDGITRRLFGPTSGDPRTQPARQHARTSVALSGRP
jgi:transposase